MRYIRTMCGVFFCIILAVAARSQAKSENKLSKITPADFAVTSPLIDSNSNAIILADIGSSDFVGNNSGDFTLVYKEHKRILLRNRNSFDEATIKVQLYNASSSAMTEKFDDLEAITYNLENGQVIATRLDKASVFTEKVNNELTVKKFTFPNIKEGSIVDYQYTIRSPYYTRLKAWYFQDAYPCLWSQYSVFIPHMFHYLITKTGYLPYAIDSARKEYKTYSIIESGGIGASDRYSISGDAIVATWAMKDVPALKNESFITSTRNVVSKIRFQLKDIKFSEDNTKLIVKDWHATAAELMDDADFGLELTRPNNWVGELPIPGDKTDTDFEKAQKIYEYIRDNFKCTDHDTKWLSQSLKKTLHTRTGNVADINLLLALALINKNITTDPVLLSTRDNGFANDVTPLLTEYNYVLVKARIDTVDYLLDASQPHLGFGKLSSECYNGSARVINKTMPVLVDLSPESLKEDKNTLILFINNVGNGVFEGAYTSNLGYIESRNLRDKLGTGKSDEYFKGLKKGYGNDISIDNLLIDSLKKYEQPVSVHYDMKMNFNGEDILYVNPMFNEAWKKNPFTAASRIYPVEMPYRMRETYVLNMEIPKGYKVDELPKSARVKFEEDGMFEYIIGKSEKNVQLRCVLSIQKAVFAPEDYDSLREFFAFVVKKQSEQIVFKKIK